MTTYKVDDLIGQCPVSDCGGDVLYKGGTDAICASCESTYLVSFEEDEVPDVDDVVNEEVIEDEPEPDPLSSPELASEIGNLTENISGDPALMKKGLELDPQKVDTVNSGDVKLPDYIKKSRPWKWAQSMSKTGNPYRADSKSWMIFNIFDEREMTIEEAVAACVDLGITDKMSYLLTVYEVVTQCVAAGLLVIDPQIRKIGVCQGIPQAAQMP
ncbi:MAG: hypothetical protein CMB80_01335 [Flammeovirgaceae bacterium]|nr:hypothetical protein [Flammeovirgaceae bacterium]